MLTKARRGSGTDEVVKALGVLDVWAAQQLQARWRCIQVRRQFLLDHRGVDPTAAVKEQILRQRRASSSTSALRSSGSGQTRLAASSTSSRPKCVAVRLLLKASPSKVSIRRPLRLPP